jgi:superfamily II DNA/RNA helicase
MVSVYSSCFVCIICKFLCNGAAWWRKHVHGPRLSHCVRDGHIPFQNAPCLLDDLSPFVRDASELRRIQAHGDHRSANGAILVFLPGWAEISDLRRKLTEPSSPFSRPEYSIHALHSQVPPGAQQRAFVPARRGERKIVLATNVAEASVTIPDVVCVIDSGRAKEKSHNEATGVSALRGRFISKASAQQRRGRAGRVRPGVCYKLYTREQAEALDVRCPAWRCNTVCCCFVLHG